MTPHRVRRERAIWTVILVGTGIVFTLDLLVPLGVAIGVPYVAIVLLTLWLPDRKSIFKTAGLVTVLAMIGLFAPDPQIPREWEVVINRSLTLFVVWVAAILGNRIHIAQEATRLERDFNESLVTTASSIILVLDLQGQVIFFNEYTEDCLSLQLRDMSGKDWFEHCVPVHDRPRAREVFRRCIDDSLVRESQFAVLTNTGQERMFSWSARPIRHPDQKLSRVLFVGQDISTLLETQQRMANSERLAVIGQTIAAVSHESRNELMALKMGLEVLNATVTDPAARQVIERTQQVQIRLDRMLDDLRHFAGPLPLERSACSLQEIWRRAWSSLTGWRTGRDARVREHIDCPDLACFADAMRMEQVFRNIFENALAACPDPVWIDIRAAKENVGSQPVLRVYVRDNGPGLSSDAKARIFEPFFSTKQGGTGLGMAISRRILTAHDGTIKYSETNESGAEFIIEIPGEEKELG